MFSKTLSENKKAVCLNKRQTVNAVKSKITENMKSFFDFFKFMLDFSIFCVIIAFVELRNPTK